MPWITAIVAIMIFFLFLFYFRRRNIAELVLNRFGRAHLQEPGGPVPKLGRRQRRCPSACQHPNGDPIVFRRSRTIPTAIHQVPDRLPERRIGGN